MPINYKYLMALTNLNWSSKELSYNWNNTEEIKMDIGFEIRKQILIDALTNGLYEPEFEMPSDDDINEFFCENHYDMCSVVDAEEEFRCSGVETNLGADYSRHYEAEQVAKQLSCGAWVSWTFWFGGGKHGQPESVEWIDQAYQVDCSEEVKTITVRTFKQLDNQ